jgi:protein-S-isoprenylcysteine O-methyltransferase Ste14
VARQHRRRALGALFVVLAAVFSGVAFTAFASEPHVVVYGIGVVAAALALWIGSLALRALWHRPR